jgi:hypothetical protein
MLAIQKRQKYIQKAVQLPNGEWALVVFELVERNGKIIARAVSGHILDDFKIEKEKVLCLPCVKTPTEFVPVLSTFNFIDFINFSSDFSFVMSQPTRAPSF